MDIPWRKQKSAVIRKTMNTNKTHLSIMFLGSTQGTNKSKLK